ncbi:peptidase [Peromfec virus RodF8_14]|uniref:Peptidase n=1 Tax=Peromfec virus RodF8_14 TaxID=2929359 RepID=A0A976N1Y8_9VIRU|nr:peptidase [Peromfec virus RodF8_14]
MEEKNKSLLAKYNSYSAVPSNLMFAFSCEYLNRELKRASIVHFTAEEFMRSNCNPSNKIPISTFREVMLCAMLTLRNLSRLRDAFGLPIYINSGYRNLATNALVKGATRSRHLYGLAADIRPALPKNLEKLWQLVNSDAFKNVFTEKILHDTYIHVAL